MTDAAPRLARPGDAVALAHLLHDFNAEFGTPTPGPATFAARLERLLAREDVFAVLAGEPPLAFALLVLRPVVWYEGRAAVLDELYVRPDRRGQGIGTGVIREAVRVARERGAEYVELNVDEGDTDAQRFYRREGFSDADPDTSERAFYFFREL